MSRGRRKAAYEEGVDARVLMCKGRGHLLPKDKRVIVVSSRVIRAERQTRLERRHRRSNPHPSRLPRRRTPDRSLLLTIYRRTGRCAHTTPCQFSAALDKSVDSYRSFSS